jgi:PAS domain S-box-containing protein
VSVRTSAARWGGGFTERLELAIRATGAVVWDWDIRSDLAVFNDVVESVFGYDERSVSSSWFFERMHPGDVPRLQSGLAAALSSGVSHLSSEFRFRRANGEWASVIGRSLILREDGAAVRMVGTMIDVTERVQLEERQAASLIHELNNVLMAVIQVGELIGRFYPDDPRLVRMADQLFTAVSRGKRILPARSN